MYVAVFLITHHLYQLMGGKILIINQLASLSTVMLSMTVVAPYSVGCDGNITECAFPLKKLT